MPDERSPRAERASHAERGPVTERTTLIVAVDTEQDEEARLATIRRQVGEGWRVVQTVPLSGGGAGPGGGSETFMRLQVTLERELEPGPEEQMVVRPPEEDAGPAEAPNS